ncbi:hypothetical protein OG689_38950 [Kitasatospora sp. NBC_00240]|uniref:hypothetical protein n=1 Tax=Kitasatospora sp. NBC_00240 TaxID=2903567 RepID=UPI00224EB5EF|nr:hypothetical protein [Kitasatospora sp. NBC_00240]MCX5215175.1 hypothetical protein [Kitasatospora sp. NBC_00240]
MADHTTVLGIRTDDLAALTGLDLPAGTRPPSRTTVDLTGLVGDVRRLTYDQVQRVCESAKTR